MRIIFRLILFLLISTVLFLSYMTFIGLETKKFNNQITKKIKDVDQNLDLELKEIKLIFDPFSFSINAKTIGPKLRAKNKIINLENVKTRVSLISLINNKFSLKNLKISTKSLKIKDLISFIRIFNSAPEFYFLDKIIKNGYIITDIELDFDNQGKIKDNYSINGFLKDIEVDFFRKYVLKELNFIFNFEDKKFISKDISFKLNDIKFFSEKIFIKKIEDNFFIKALINNNRITLSEKKIDEFIKPLKNNYDIKKVIFSSKNIFSFNLNEKFQLEDLEIETSILIEKLILQNNLNLKKFFPNIKEQISLLDHKLNLKYKEGNFTIDGTGDLLFQNAKDQLTYKFERKNKVLNFVSSLTINNNPFLLDILNFEKNKNEELEINFKGYQNKKKQIFFNQFFLKEKKNRIDIENLKLNDKYKILDLKTVNFDYYDKENQRNLFRLYKKDKQYFLEGAFLNVNSFIEKILEDGIKKSSSFHLFNKININIDKVRLDKLYSVNNLFGNLSFKNKQIFNANILGIFPDNKEFKLSIDNENNNKITNLLIEKAEPIIKRYNFIKGFEGGKLDFYSLEKNKIIESKLKIYDFKLKKMPALTKILTLASLQGIEDILSGEGIRFDEFEMTFQNQGNLMTIKEIYAIGPAISIMMEGYIEKDRLVSLKGTLVPATTINKFIGSLPVLGEILVGKKIGEGVFGVSFKIKGPPKNLETSVNPIKTLTPRFITRTLEKLKKN